MPALPLCAHSTLVNDDVAVALRRAFLKVDAEILHATASGGTREALAAVAGHFEWGAWGEMPSTDMDPPHCLTIVRHPVDRAISFFYERVYQRDDVGGVRVNDWSLPDFKWLLGAFRGSAFSMYRDEGLCDQVCKNLLGRATHRGKTEAEVSALGARSCVELKRSPQTIYVWRQRFLCSFGTSSRTFRVVTATSMRDSWMFRVVATASTLRMIYVVATASTLRMIHVVAAASMRPVHFYSAGPREADAPQRHAGGGADGAVRRGAAGGVACAGQSCGALVALARTRGRLSGERRVL